MWNSSEGLRALSQLLIWMAFSFAILAAAATLGRYFVDRRWNELKAAERAIQEASLRTQVKDADEKARSAEAKAREAQARAGDAETRAVSAAEKADQAHALANRHQPQPLAPAVGAAVVGQLRAWAKKETGPLDLVIVGGDDPGVNHAVRTLAQLLREGGVLIGNVTNIGMAPGRHVALVSVDPASEAVGRGLASALKPLIDNVVFSVQPGARLTLSINGLPSFKPNGSFVIE